MSLIKLRKSCLNYLAALAGFIFALLAFSAEFATVLNYAAQNRIVGEITAIDKDAKRIIVKTDNGVEATLIFDDKTVYLRVPPGEVTLDKATKISLEDISIGDRVLVFGNVAESGKPVPIRQLVLMSKASITQQQENARRGVVGRVIAIDYDKKEISAIVSSREGVKTLIINASGNVKFLRYAPDSVKRSDAVASSFDEIKVGDLFRVQGEKNADGTRITAEEITAGSFLRAGGTVTAVNIATGEVTIKTGQTGQPLSIVIGKRSMLRRIPPDVAESLEQRQSSGKSLQERLEKSPAITIADLKKGDVILVSGTMGTDRSRVTAVMLLTGEKTFMARLLQTQQRNLQYMNPGLPGDVLGGGSGFQDPL